MDKKNVVYLYNWIVINHKMQWKSETGYDMNLENIMLSETNKLQNITYIIQFLWNIQIGKPRS